MSTLVRLGRFAVGHPISGEHKTNAGWIKPGTDQYDPHRAGWWAHQSHRRRAAIRWSALVGVVAVVVGFAASPAATAGTLRPLAWFGLFLAGYVVVHKTRRWQHFKQWTEAVALAVGPMLGMPRHRNPHEWVHVPVGHQDDPDKPIELRLPEGFSWPETRRDKLAKLVASVGGVQAPHWVFDFEARPPTLTVATSPQPPKLVVFAEVLRHWEQADPDEVVVGLASGGTPVRASLATDSPHILCSMGSGGGKSEFCCGVTLQMRARGARTIYLDFIKRGASAKWAKGIADIEVIRSTELAYEAILDIYDEVQRRCGSYWDHGYDESQQRLFVVLDEANRSLAELKRYEAQLRRDDKEAPSAVDALEGILFVGREARTNVLTVGQRMSARATGGGDAREAYGIKIGNRFSPATARMLFSDVGDGTKASLPRSSNHPGRVQVVTGGAAVEAQVPLLIDRSTKKLLSDPAAWLDELPVLGMPAPRRESVTSHPVRPGETPIHDVDRRHLAVVPTVVEPAAPAVTLVDLATAATQLADRFPGITKATLANFRAREKAEFPKVAQRAGQTFLYDLAELERFLMNHPQAGAATCP